MIRYKYWKIKVQIGRVKNTIDKEMLDQKKGTSILGFYQTNNIFVLNIEKIKAY